MHTNLPNPYHHELTKTCAIELVLVQPGTFIMGSEEEDAYSEEKPEHLVKITQPFYISRHPITQKIWTTVMDGYNPSYFKGANRPVEKVSWLDIVKGGQDEKVPISFLDRLAKQFPLPENSGIPKAFQFRLPTEAEWEYAAKGGHYATPPNVEQAKKAAQLYTKYAGSDKLKEVGWFDTNSHRETKAVGQKVANELGLLDMTGNVWEWCLDGHDSEFYKKCKEEKDIFMDPYNQYKEENSWRVLRGGSWNNGPQYCRVSCRYGYLPAGRFYDYGFRLVLSPSLKEC